MASSTVPDIDLMSSDAEIVGAAADVLAVPRRDEADSFVLHAPLELLARTALLRFVRADRRDAARGRIVEIATSFDAFGAPVGVPTVVEPVSLPSAASALDRAIDSGDLDRVDALAAWIGDHARPHQLRALLSDALVARLAAAGHAPILLWLFPRVAPRSELSGQLLRQLCRELARHPTWRIRWIDDHGPADGEASADEASAAEASTAGTCTAADLAHVLAGAPRLGRPANSFIQPLMSRVDTAELAGRLLGRRVLAVAPDDVQIHGRSLTRVAAWSMLTEPTDEAPYGWSHCLTMPQAVLGIAGSSTRPARALAIAATHVLGFRASLATVALDETIASWWSPTGLTLSEALAAGPESARATMWHAPPTQRRELITVLATFAATHHDAHLAKYTLACIDAAALDPEAERVYLSAAATLAGWWAVHPDGVDIS